MLGSNSMLLILLFKLFRLWPLASLSGLLLCPLDQPPNLLIFEPFLIFKHYTKLQAHLVFPFFSPRTNNFSKRDARTFDWRIVSRNQIWALSVLIDTRWSLVLSSLCGQSQEMDVCILTHVYIHICNYFWVSSSIALIN